MTAGSHRPESPPKHHPPNNLPAAAAHMDMNRRRRHHIPLEDESGQGMAEYSLLFGFIAIVVAGALPSAQAAISSLYDGLLAVLGG